MCQNSISPNLRANENFSSERKIFEMPKNGAFITNQVISTDVITLTRISSLYGHLDVKQAYIRLNELNPNQRLKGSSLAFGRGKDFIWFAYCDAKGQLLTQIPVATIYFNFQA
jgi:hypothetical protein